MGCWITRQCSLKRYCITNATSNNQRLRSAGDNDGRLKSFFSNAVLCVSFKWQMDRSTRVQITSDRRSKRAWSNCIMCIPFILNGSPTECWLNTYIQRMRNNNLEITIAGSSCRSQKIVRIRNDLNKWWYTLHIEGMWSTSVIANTLLGVST